MLKILEYLLIAPIWLYQKMISPFFPSTCRFNPTCSNYAMDAIKLKGPFVGFWLALKRILKCHPWGGTGYDPIPLYFQYAQNRHAHPYDSKKSS